MNVIPKCTNSLSKYPHYENLPETYSAINDYLLESPLEGYPYLQHNTAVVKLESFYNDCRLSRCVSTWASTHYAIK